MDEEELASKQRKADAQKEKEAGNAAYKARQFEKAIQHYDRAVELDDSDISFLTNRQAEPSKASLVLQECRFSACHRQAHAVLSAVMLSISSVLSDGKISEDENLSGA